ncbi:cytochrome B [Methylobacterium sp. Leaf469]|uniref:cytochrome b/b6 domain-containing protein n=1 Tax=Methylobacterium sp. Leaf469 TaxID=1736387 RepID=UPI0006F79DC9|nr:cytochrome b/b6 domain-containing protein [Methylobacterium sp. Leaf469]KQU02323.1 cytochrome B [Methylobacterium sp. Leaf469]
MTSRVPRQTVFRHRAWVRLTHWVNTAAFGALLVSGIAILLALPRLFWGETGANDAPAALALPLPVNLEQTGWGRNLHFLAAWILVLNGGLYLLLALFGGHLRRNLLPDRDQLAPDHLAREIADHARLRPATGREALRYNALQKFAYLAVILGLFPLMVLTGLTMSPGVTAAFPELFTLFGGRQSARTLHFVFASLLVLFLLVHVGQVFVGGAVNLTRSMITGRFAVPPDTPANRETPDA